MDGWEEEISPTRSLCGIPEEDAARAADAPLATETAAKTKQVRKLLGRITSHTYLLHSGCPDAAAWRAATGEFGFPPFEPVMHTRYDQYSIYLKCVGCGTALHYIIRTDISEIEST